MQTIIAGIMLLGILVFIHELGHFLVAKLCGVRVLTFSLGFGPKIVGFQWGDTEYKISLLPLGGFVRMFGDNPEETLAEEDKQYSFLHQVLWKKRPSRLRAQSLTLFYRFLFFGRCFLAPKSVFSHSSEQSSKGACSHGTTAGRGSSVGGKR